MSENKEIKKVAEWKPQTKEVEKTKVDIKSKKVEWKPQTKKVEKTKVEIGKKGGVAKWKPEKKEVRKKRASIGHEDKSKVKLTKKEMEYFNKVTATTFSEQASQFLNAFWNEIGDQAEFIFCLAYDQFKKADMHAKGVKYVHLYEEGTNVDFNIGLYFFEKLCKRLETEGKNFPKEKYGKSYPTMMTALKRKAMIKKVDVNFDGRISFLEYLLDQYSEFADPQNFCLRSMDHGEHPEMTKAKEALGEVTKKINAYEKEKMRLEKESKLEGVKGLRAKNQLEQLAKGKLVGDLNTALIKAQAAMRKVTKKFGDWTPPTKEGEKPTIKASDKGALWWLNRDLKEKKSKYGPKKGGIKKGGFKK